MKPYLTTGNLAVDMVAACVNHAEWHHKKVKRIYLKNSYWIMFSDYFKRQDPAYTFTTEINFDGVMVQKASIFQSQPLYYKLEKTEIV